MKRMLFNATQAEELRVAIVDGQKLIDLDIESAAKEQRKSNIYKGVITRIEPSLEAAFVDYGAERHGFLPFKEVSRSYFQPGVDAGKASIKEALREGQELIVQVDKDERGNKGAALTTYISLAGRYLVLMPNNPRGGGVSRRVEGDERSELRENLSQLNVPDGMSIIARTAAIGRAADELEWDLNYLVQLWTAIDSVSAEHKAPLLIYQEGSLVIRAIRDYFHSEIGEILIDTEDVYEQARAFMGQVMPANVSRVKHYRDDVPLFSRFQIEHQIESAYSRQVNLPAGGAIVIDHTEALVSVDVNSGRATRGSDIEETAFRTNCEAADEIARQLRLRDLGGLIVIDFIDMESTKNQREVENRLRDALRHDRARVQMGKISRFGLMELSRQRLRPALAETSYIACPRCTGTGHIRSTESAALHILRILEEEAMKENTGAVHTQVPVDVATFLLNEKRSDIQAIEIRQKINILIIPNTQLETPAHKIVRLRHDDLNHDDIAQPSYRMAETEEIDAKVPGEDRAAAKPRPQAAIRSFTPDQPAPMAREPEAPAAVAPPTPVAKTGVLSRFVSWLMGEKPAEPAAGSETNADKPAARKSEAGRGERRDGRRNERRGGRSGERRDGRSEGDKPRNRPERGERDESRGKAARPAPADAPAATPAVETPADATPRGERGDKSERGSRRNRGSRKERPEAEVVAAAEPAVIESIEATGEVEATPEIAADGSTGERSRGRRGRRGGRRNGERQNRDAQGTDASPDGEAADTPVAAEDVTAPADVTAVAAMPAVEAATPAEAAAPQPAPVIDVIPVTTEPTPAPSEATPTQAIADAAPAPSVAPQPVVAEPVISATIETASPAADAAPVEPIDVGAALADSGLVMIETAPGAAQAEPEAPQVPRGRPRRRAAVAASSEPMEQVETGRPSA